MIPPPPFCGTCGAAYDHTDIERCSKCGQRFHPPQDEFQFRICGTALASRERMGAFERFVKTLSITARALGDELEITVGVPASSSFTLPAHIGLTLLAAPRAYTGEQDAFVELGAGASVAHRISARGRGAGSTAIFALTYGDAYEEIELPIA